MASKSLRHTLLGNVVAGRIDMYPAPAVNAIQLGKDGKVIDGFMGAYPEHVVQEFIDALVPTEGEEVIAGLLAEGTEGAYRKVLDLEPGNEDAIVGLAESLVARGENDEALQYLARIPETDRTRVVAAMARTHLAPDDDHDATLTALLPSVKVDEAARQQFLDILELMGPNDPRTASYRKQLTARLF